MESCSQPRATEFFDDLASRRSVVGTCILWAVSVALLYLAIRYSGLLWKHGQFAILAFGWLSLITIAGSVPNTVRDYVEAFHGEPAVRLDQRGIWARDWASMGWIEWADIEAMRVAGKPSAPRDLEIRLRDERRYLARMSWIDRLSLVTLRLFDRCMDFFPHDGQIAHDRAIAVASSGLLQAQWDPLLTALAPILAAKGIPLEEDTDDAPAA